MAHQKWRLEINPGDRIDVCIQADDKGRITGWVQAIVTDIDEENFMLQFPELPPHYDGVLDKWSTYIAKPGSKTKEPYRWREATFVDGDDKEIELDGHDNSSWCKSTILKREKRLFGERVVEMCFVGFRVYRKTDNQYRKDDRGTYEGWSDRFDEWIPLYSPRLMPYEAHSGKNRYVEEIELDEDNDEQLQPEPGFTRVYVVPRNFKCTSGKFLHFMNYFGNH